MEPELAPVSGRRRAASPAPAGAGRPLPQLAALAVAVVGGLLIVAGALQATVLAPSPVSRATLTSPQRPVITTAVGLLGLDGPRLQVEARDGAGRQVFAGIGRAADVDAYLAQASRLEVTGHDGDGGLLTEQAGTEPSLPDPAAADVWVTSARGPGAASLSWPDAPGQWRLVVATDGSAPAPQTLWLTWSGREPRSIAPVLVAVGLLLALAGLITRVLLSSDSGTRS